MVAGAREGWQRYVPRSRRRADSLRRHDTDFAAPHRRRCLVAAPAALAAIKDGSYKGASRGKIEVRVPDPVLGNTFKKQTDKGKVSFSVKRGASSPSRSRARRRCATAGAVDVEINSARCAWIRRQVGKGTYTAPRLAGRRR